MAASEPAQPSGREYLRLVLLGALVGIPAGLVGALFLGLVHELEDVLWPDDPEWYLIVGLPVAGAVVVFIARRFLPGDGGHEPLKGLSMAVMPISYAPGIALAAVGTLAFGAVLGPEAPVIALGAITAVAVTSAVRLGDQERTVLSTAGSFSAISALFGGPIVAGVMMIEAGVGLGARLIPALLPGFVAAAVGYLVFIGFGDWGGLSTPGVTVPDLPLYEGTHLGDLVVALATGVLTALLLTVIKRAAGRVVDVPLGLAPLLLAGGLLVGLLALLETAFGGDSQEVLFSGQSAIPDLVVEGSTGVLLSILVLKALAYAVSLGCGFRGGPIFPALFVGVGIASFPHIWFDTSPTLVIAVGAAAGLAAQTRFILSAMVFAALLVGTQGLATTPAAVLAAAAAWLTVSALDQRRATAAAPAA
jgi:H+/Cl- antiporter ClcA